jgi:hypothetical protein
MAISVYDGNNIIYYNKKYLNNNLIKIKSIKNNIQNKNYKFTQNQLHYLVLKMGIKFNIVNCTYDTLLYIFHFYGVENNLNIISKYTNKELNTFSKSINIDKNDILLMLKKYNLR